MSPVKDERRGFHASHEKLNQGTIGRIAEPLEQARAATLAGEARDWLFGPALRLVSRRHGSRGLGAGTAEKVEPMRPALPEYRTTVAIGRLTVTGVLPGPSRLRDVARPREPWIAIGGYVHHMTCDRALELADALLLVVLRMDGVAEERLERG